MSKSEWWGSVLLCRNYTRILHLQDLTIQAYFTGHFWSLSVEEHFYVVLPALLLFFRGKARVPVMLAIAAAVVLNRCLQLRVRPYDLIAFHTDARLDALMLPAALAVAVRLTSWRVPIRSLLRWWILFAIAAVTLVASECGDGWKSLGIAVLMPCAVMGSVLNPSDWVARFLEWTPLRFIGRLSYSLYLWQTLFFTGHFYQLRPLGFLEMFPFNFMATFAIAMASYYCVERPMVKVGHRIVLRIGAVRQQLAGR